MKHPEHYLRPHPTNKFTKQNQRWEGGKGSRGLGSLCLHQFWPSVSSLPAIYWGNGDWLLQQYSFLRAGFPFCQARRGWSCLKPHWHSLPGCLRWDTDNTHRRGWTNVHKRRKYNGKLIAGASSGNVLLCVCCFHCSEISQSDSLERIEANAFDSLPTLSEMWAPVKKRHLCCGFGSSRNKQSAEKYSWTKSVSVTLIGFDWDLWWEAFLSKVLYEIVSTL